MSEIKKFSVFVRTICGAFAVLGLASSIYLGLKMDEFVFELRHFAIGFACSVFLYVAVTGVDPISKFADKFDDSK